MLLIYFFSFWFKELPVGLFEWFLAFNKAFLQFLSLPLMLQTFFKPIKNEYREGLVGFSIGMGMAFKSILILLDTVLLIILLGIELALYPLIVLFPILTILILLIQL